MNHFESPVIVMADQVLKDAQSAQNIIAIAKAAAREVEEDALVRFSAAEVEAKKCLDMTKDKAEEIIQDAPNKIDAMNVELENWEEEKKRITTLHRFEATIKLDVGGHLFTTTLATLTRFPNTMLGAMFSGRHVLFPDTNGAYFIDRDGRYFHYVLNFLRDPESWDKTDFPQLYGNALVDLRIEADFYGLKDFMFSEPEPVRVGVYRIVVNNGNTKFTIARALTATITQGKDQLWYLQHDDEHFLRILALCEKCGCGVIACHHIVSCQCFVVNFKALCIDPTQPRKSTCLQCREYPKNISASSQENVQE